MNERGAEKCLRVDVHAGKDCARPEAEKKGDACGEKCGLGRWRFGREEGNNGCSGCGTARVGYRIGGVMNVSRRGFDSSTKMESSAIDICSISVRGSPSLLCDFPASHASTSLYKPRIQLGTELRVRIGLRGNVAVVWM